MNQQQQANETSKKFKTEIDKNNKIMIKQLIQKKQQSRSVKSTKTKHDRIHTKETNGKTNSHTFTQRPWHTNEHNTPISHPQNEKHFKLITSQMTASQTDTTTITKQDTVRYILHKYVQIYKPHFQTQPRSWWARRRVVLSTIKETRV